MGGRAGRVVEVYLEVGAKRTFAAGLKWPGWCRAGRDEESALAALVTYAPRYGAVVAANVPFRAPTDVGQLRVVERLRGDASTDFGAPGRIPSADESPMKAADLARSAAILCASWAAFDRAAADARGHFLRKGPRGGGRELGAIVDHVVAAERGYIAQLGGSAPGPTPAKNELVRVHDAALAALEAAARGEYPKVGPRGGRRWPPRYFVRRAAWHVLDHVWEVEDRVAPERSGSAPAEVRAR